ncbi:PepSY-associated TM helix domain-containing protein [Sunxiuqinia sp. A32]|uniref:PepSY-associated TM helix domain-containing protein n=1 Tax=Sunxiuqinia sp. A32 TaxID=3461496 RepID=UPI004045D278
MKIRKLLRVLHRDFGYLITGMVIIYAVSGIALNHRKDWNPHHIIVHEEIQIDDITADSPDQHEIDRLLEGFEYQPKYKKHYTTASGILKIFVENGMVIYYPYRKIAELEILEKRPVFYAINKLHLAGTKRAWIWVSDILSVVLIFVTISGLFLLKGKNGLLGRGWWLTLIGFAIPGIFLLFYIS